MRDYFGSRNKRQAQRAFYEKTQTNAQATRRDLDQPINKRQKTKASSEWWYKGPAIASTIAVVIGIILFAQFALMTFNNFEADIRNGLKEPYTMFSSFGIAPIYLFLIVISPGIWWVFNKKIKAVWMNNNAMFLSEDIEEYTNDAYVQTKDHITRNFEPAPDAGMGFDGHVSTIVGHMMVDNKGIKKVDFPVLDPDVEGQVAKDRHGQVITQKMPMFDRDFAIDLYKFSNVPPDFQHWIDATDYDYNPKASKKEQKVGIMRKGAFGRKDHDTLADYINAEFYPLETETQRPAGVYFYDSRPVNTILIAITRAGKGAISRLIGRPVSPIL